jgi:lysine/ornithine N-monooxygenase
MSAGKIFHSLGAAGVAENEERKSINCDVINQEDIQEIYRKTYARTHFRNTSIRHAITHYTRLSAVTVANL